jgi:hypothetical protein
MLTDAALRALKPKEKAFKVADRDGMYVHVTTKGAMSFRMDYRLNGRRETLFSGSTVLTAFRSRGRVRSASMRGDRSLTAFLRRSRNSAKSGVSKRQRASANLATSGSRRPQWRTGRGRCDARSSSVSYCQYGAIAC